MLKKICIKSAVICFSTIIIMMYTMPQISAETMQPEQSSYNSDFGLRCGMRKLWIDHTFWTKSYIVSALENLPDKEKVLARLLKNQKDIGNAIKPYYGEAAGDELTKLLTEHILIAGKIVDAAQKGEQGNLKALDAEWHRNADEIAEFLSKANPYWSYANLKNLLYIHLKFVADQAVTRLKKDYDAEIEAFDEGEDHILKLADALSEGIIKQFPQKFK
ncbi:glycosyltransferase [Bacillus sp. 1P06AnD]|uniref:glycosyltransferase n=1 Tax=Bacillus sp. 1P06AnD TaxID=3132208 RepID=UPI00399F9F75